MPNVINLEEARLNIVAKRGYRNWNSRFSESFGLKTRLSQVSLETLSYLAQGKEDGAFYFYDLIMNIKALGSGFEFDELDTRVKMALIDLYLFLLDQTRYEIMKRLGWVESYPGEEYTLIELIIQFDSMGPNLLAKIPTLSKDHPSYEKYCRITTLEKESFIRKLIPEALKEVRDYSTTL